MTHYEVHLKSADTPVPLDADKFLCEEGFVAFYTRSAPKEPFEETARFAAKNVKRIEER